MKNTIKKIVAAILIICMLPLGDISYINVENTSKAYAAGEDVDNDITGWKAADDIVIEDNVKLERDETVNSLTVNGTLDLNGYKLSVNSDVEINGRILFHTGGLICGGDFTFGENAYCYLRDEEDYLVVIGNFTDKAYDRKNAILFKNGSIHLKGNYDVKSGISYEDCTMYLEGKNRQDIRSFAAFENMVINKTENSAVNIYVLEFYQDAYTTLENNSNTPVNINKISQEEFKLIKLTEDTIIYDDLEIRDRIYDLNGYTLEVAGDLSIYSGKIILNGGTLLVDGELSNTYGYIDMVDDNDRIVVEGWACLIGNDNFKLSKGEFIAKSGLYYNEGEIHIDNTFYIKEMHQDDGTVCIGGKVYLNEYYWRTWGWRTVISFNHGTLTVFDSFEMDGIQGRLIMNMYYEDDIIYWCNGITRYAKSWSAISDELENGIFYTYEDIDGKLEGDNKRIYDEGKEKYEEKINYDWDKAEKRSKSDDILINDVLTEDVTIDENLGIYGRHINLNGHTLIVRGDMEIGKNYSTKESITFNGGKLIVEGDLINNVHGEGLVLDNQSDELVIHGKYIGKSDEVITSGTMEIYGGINLWYGDNLKIDNDAVLKFTGNYFNKITLESTWRKINISNLIVDCNKDIYINDTLKINKSIDIKRGIINKIWLGRYAKIVNNYIHANITFDEGYICDEEIFIDGDIEVLSGSLYVKNKLKTGNILFKNQSWISMGENAEIECDDFKYMSYSSSDLYRGRIICSGNMSVNDYFRSGFDYQLELNGSKAQEISYDNRYAKDTNYDACINKLIINNTSSEDVLLGNHIIYNEIEKNGKSVTFKMDSDFDVKKDKTIDGNLLFDNSNYSINVADNSVLAINGNLILIDGNIQLGSDSGKKTTGAIQVKGDVIAKKAKVKQVMFNSKNESVLRVEGNILPESDLDLKNTNLQLAGDILDVTGYNLKLNNKLVLEKENTELGKAIVNSGEVICNGKTIYSEGLIKTNKFSGYNVLITGRPDLYIPNINGISANGTEADIYLTRAAKLDKNYNISGDLYVLNSLDIDNKELNVENLYIGDGSSSYPKLYMNNPEGKICVNKNMVFNSRENHSDKLTAGEIKIRGNLDIQSSGTFYTSGTNRIIMTESGGENKQSINDTDFYIENIVLRRRIDSRFYNFPYDIKDKCGNIIYEFDEDTPPFMSERYDIKINGDKVKINFDAATDDSEVVGYLVYKDGNQIKDIQGLEFTDDNLKQGFEYTYQIVAYDDCDNRSEPLTITVSVGPDEEPPAVPKSFTVEKRSGSKITLSWQEPTDNVKVTGYNIYRGEEKIAQNVTETRFTDSGLFKGIVYEYRVTALDKAGNESEKSEVVSGYVRNPVINSIIPSDNYMMSGNNVYVEIEVDDIGRLGKYTAKAEYIFTSGLAGFDEVNVRHLIAENIVVDNKKSGKIISGGFNWDISDLNKSGNCEVIITVTDEDGNSTEKSVVYKYDITPPENPTDINIASENGNNIIKYTASKSADCAGYNIYRRESEEEEYILIGTVNDKFTVRYEDEKSVPEREYEYAVSAFDQCRNESEKTKGYKIVTSKDEEPPRITGISPEDTGINKKVSIVVEAEDNKELSFAEFWYEKENTNTKVYIGKSDFSEKKAAIELNTVLFEDGVYYVTAEATDKSGNTSPAVKKRYIMDNTGTNKTSFGKCSISSTYIQLRWEDIEDEDFGYFRLEEVSEDIWGTKKINYIADVHDTLGYTVYGLAPGTTHYYQVTGYDNLGNRGETSDIISITTNVDDTSPVIRSIGPVQSYYKDSLKLTMEVYDNYSVSRGVFSYSIDGENYSIITTKYNNNVSSTVNFDAVFNISKLEDGDIYIKFEAYDYSGNKNALLANGEEVIARYIKDSKAPDAPVNPKAFGESGNIKLMWDLADDVNGYQIYRRGWGEKSYVKIAENVKSNTYYDTNVEAGKTYLYYITAKDIAGNESSGSEVVNGTASDDVTAPVLTEIKTAYVNDEGEYITGGKGSIKVGATDESGVASIYIEYRKFDKDTEMYIPLSEATGSDRKILLETGLENEDLENGAYSIRAYAVDIHGNKSDYKYGKIHVDTTPPETPNLKVTPGGYKVSISISENDEKDFEEYRIYRKELTDSEYTLINSITEDKYTDKNLIPGITYVYKIEAYDMFGNMSQSEEIMGVPTDEDDESPVAVMPENILTYPGYEIFLDGMASHDNVRIKEYIWDLGNGDTLKGSSGTYTYEKEGVYTLKLTVKDAAGNKDTAITCVHVSEKSRDTKATITVTDKSGTALAYANVYVIRPDGTKIGLMTDAGGNVNISGIPGKYTVAAYAGGYYPKEEVYDIEEGDDKELIIVLEKGEIVQGKLTVQRMTLQEITEAGVDISDPDNLNLCKFAVDLKLEQTPIPRRVEYVDSGDGVTLIEVKRKPAESGGGSAGDINTGGGVHEEEKAPRAVRISKDEPVIAIINTNQTISWLKEMYNVNLTILNAADSKYYIKNSQATLNLPEGLSLAKTKDNQSLTVDMGKINGQEEKSVNWVVKGDKSGNYKLTASFNGTLMPFEKEVMGEFETEEEFKVSTGEGLHVYVYPEDAAYIGENYYIQFEIANESAVPFYNFTTSIGDYRYEDNIYKAKVYYPDGTVYNQDGTESEEERIHVYSISGQMTQMPVIKNGEKLQISTLMPGASVKGTYHTRFEGEGNSEEVYYKLVEAVAKQIGGNSEGVKFTVCKPINSHIVNEIVNVKLRGAAFGDPVDISTGSFTDEISLMSAGNTEVKINYNSRLNETEGTCGFGFYSNIETYVEDDGNMIRLYLSPGIYGDFIRSDAADRIYYGKKVGETLYLDEIDGYGEYESISGFTKGYSLNKNEDGTYTVKTPAKEIYTYNSEGKVIKAEDENGRVTTFSHTEKKCIITDAVTGMRLILSYNDSGKLTGISDDSGRETLLTYEDGKLVRLKDAGGEERYFEYDENNRITAEKDCEEVAYVTNEYDNEGRVIKQQDADILSGSVTFEYNTEGENTVVTVHDKAGNEMSATVDNRGRIIEEKDAAGNVTQTGYDSDDNVIFEKDANGFTTLYGYDKKGRNTYIIDRLGNKTVFSYDDNDNITEITAADGKKSYYEYDDRNLPVKMTDYSGRTSIYEYDDNKNLISQETEGVKTAVYRYEKGMPVSIKDANGNETLLEYDNRGNNVKKTDALGNITLYEYDIKDRLIRETDPLGATTSYTYNKYGNILTTTDALGRTTTNTYDIQGRNTGIILPSGKKITYEYDSMGNLIKTINPDGTYKTYEYDSLGNTISETNESGEKTEYTYDSYGRTLSETNALGETIRYGYYPDGKLYITEYPDGSTETCTYDTDGNILTKATNTGKMESYGYDSMGRLTRTTDALGQSSYNEYDSLGRVVSQKDKNGNETTYTYDNCSNCTGVTDAAGNTVTYVYDGLSRITEKQMNTRANGTIKVKYEYDPVSRLTAVTDEEGNKASYEYDSCGQLIKETDPAGNTVSYEYDPDGNVTKVINPQGTATTYEYGINGEIKAENKYSNTDKKVTTSYEYDNAGRIIRVTDPLEGITSCTYDKNGNTETVTDAMGGTTTYLYDSMGRLITEISAMGTKEEYTYNADGLADTFLNGRNQKTEYIYDKLGRLKELKDEEGSIKYSYDKNSNITEVTEVKKDGQTKTIKRTYDKLNRVTTYTDSNGKTISYGYDELGNRITLTYPGGEIVRYSYYSTGRIKTVTDSEGRITFYEYDENGNLTKTERPDGSTEVCSYDSLNHLTDKTDTTADGKVINGYHYSYDEAGNITSVKEDTTDINTGANTISLKAASHLASGETEVTAREETEAEVITSNLSTLKLEYDEDNRLISYNGEKVKYDEDGNMTHGPVDGKMSDLTYDCRNRLIKITSTTGTTTYEYDAENIRTKITTPTGTITYVTDPESSLSQVLEIKVENKSGTTEKRTAYFGNGLIYEDISTSYGGNHTTTKSQYYHYNHLGSTTKLTESTGKITESYTYGTYGELLSGNKNKTPYLYNGKLGVMTDQNSLYYMRSRYYNVNIKRFINRDTVTGSLSNSQSLNRYSYVQGNPISYTDPFGTSPYADGVISGHGLLNLLGMIPGIGDLCDIANMVWYLKEGNIKMAGACALSALPMLGTVVGGTLNICKLPKAARYVKTIACCVGYGYTAFMATDAAINYGKEAYHSYKETGFSKETSKAVAGLTFSLTCAVLSGKATADNLSSAVKMLSVDTKNAWNGLRAAKQRFSQSKVAELSGKGTLASGYKSGAKSENLLEYNLQFFASKTSYGKSIENTEFFKENGGLDASDYISIHSRKHMYDPDTVSTPKKTQYGKDVNVGKLCEDTIMKPDEVIYNIDQNVMIYKKEYPFNISTSDTPTGTHRVFIPLNTQGKKTIRMSQFPLVGGN